MWGAWFVLLCWGATLYLYFKDPGLLKERFQPLKTTNQKKRAAYLLYLIGVVFLAWIAIMPLDARRYRWTTHVPMWLEIAGSIALLFSAYFICRALADNSFASPLIRIQTERQHTVVSTGVYGFVRHPMYLGALLLFLGTPLLLGSLYGTLMGLVLIFLLALRTLDEEQLLVNELEGYAEYKKKVKYRLIPFLW
jgi:protein-S-isoprenylcysteine O-methyltransferase Ste14